MPATVSRSIHIREGVVYDPEEHLEYTYTYYHVGGQLHSKIKFTATGEPTKMSDAVKLTNTSHLSVRRAKAVFNRNSLIGFFWERVTSRKGNALGKMHFNAIRFWHDDQGKPMRENFTRETFRYLNSPESCKKWILTGMWNTEMTS